MSRIADSIYYTMLSDGCSSEQAAQSASSFNDSLYPMRFDAYPMICSREDFDTWRKGSRKTVKGSLGHPGCYSALSLT